MLDRNLVVDHRGRYVLLLEAKNEVGIGYVGSTDRCGTVRRKIDA